MAVIRGAMLSCGIKQIAPSIFISSALVAFNTRVIIAQAREKEIHHWPTYVEDEVVTENEWHEDRMGIWKIAADV